MRTETEVEAPREAPQGSRSGRHRVRRRGAVLRFIGRLFLTAAVLLGSFIAWVLWGTGLFTAQAQGELRDQLEQRIQQAAPGSIPRVPVPGQAYGVLQIERMELNSVVVQGTDLEDLQRGPGHYASTADPWNRSGRVGIAGHRTTYLAPFWDLNELQRGDRITLVTARGTFEWEVTRLKIVEPQDVGVLRAPAGAGGGVRIGEGNAAAELGPSLVLTTCEPRFSAAQRLIAFARMVEPDDGPGSGGQQAGTGPLGLPGPSLFENPEELLRLVGIGTAAAFVLALALAVVGARSRRVG